MHRYLQSAKRNSFTPNAMKRDFSPTFPLTFAVKTGTITIVVANSGPVEDGCERALPRQSAFSSTGIACSDTRFGGAQETTPV